MSGTPSGPAASASRQIALADEAAGIALAAELSLFARPGDLFLLSGDLGAGKTHFARAMIRAISGDVGLDVPSPTFTLRQDYDSVRFAIAHCDLYRLGDPAEAEELDIEGALETGIALVEWPERAPALFESYQTRLAVRFDFDQGEGRIATLEGHGSWAGRLARRDAVNAFLAAAGHGGDRREFLQGDASPRRYERLVAPGGRLILMDAPAAADPGAGAGPSYSRIARLAEDVRPFIAVAGGLRAAGLNAPSIHHADARAGLILLDDLGDDRITDPAGRPIAARYEAAIDVLAHMHNRQMPDNADGYRLPVYAIETMIAEISLVCQWYVPWRRGHPPVTERADELAAAFRHVLAPVLGPADNKSWTLRDYHSPNILWVDEAEGIGRVGIIDFQDALIGPAAYDVASLCMDARTGIGPVLEEQLLARYVAARGANFDASGFRRDYATMAAQRNSKILGIFARLALRDGKDRYLAHQPRIAGYLRRALAHPHMAPVADWYRSYLPEALDEEKVLK